MFDTKVLPEQPTTIAPDGSAVRVLLALSGGGMAHFELAPQETSVATRHRTVEELWYFISGTGRMWRRDGASEEVVGVQAGVCISIPVGTEFQFQALGSEPLAAIGATMPPWPGPGEAELISGPWEATVEPGPH